eukprot:1754249-Prymnesium_polylepis.1
MCCSMRSRAMPPSSKPSSSSRARRVFISCRSMRSGTEPCPCSTLRYASTQFQLLKKRASFWRSRFWRTCSRTSTGTMSESTVSMMSWLMSDVFPAAAPAVSSVQVAKGDSTALPEQQCTWRERSHRPKPCTLSTSGAPSLALSTRIGTNCSITSSCRPDTASLMCEWRSRSVLRHHANVSSKTADGSSRGA